VKAELLGKSLKKLNEQRFWFALHLLGPLRGYSRRSGGR
jgi:hypothetical protein